MDIKVLGSGSTGNCYLVKLDSGCNIVLDAGLKKLEDLTKHINLNDVAFAFISHEHKDHSNLKEKLLLRGVEIVEGNLIQGFTKIEPVSLKSALNQVFCFEVQHGNEEKGLCPCSGIIIQSENECLLYITDFNLCRWDLSDFEFTHVMVECNYIKDLTLSNSEFVRTQENIYRHRELDGTISFLQTLNLSKCKEIYLMHLSKSFSNRIVMGAKVYSKFRIPTAVCRAYGGVDWYGR